MLRKDKHKIVEDKLFIPFFIYGKPCHFLLRNIKNKTVKHKQYIPFFIIYEAFFSIGDVLVEFIFVIYLMHLPFPQVLKILSLGKENEYWKKDTVHDLIPKNNMAERIPRTVGSNLCLKTTNHSDTYHMPK